MSKTVRGWSASVAAATVLFLLGLLAPRAAAQTFRGTVLGTVSDPSGAVIPGAKVTAKNTATGLTRETVSAADGSYSLPELPIGSYDVSASKNGFQTSVIKSVSVEVARERRIDFILSPGNIAQRVEVKEEAAAPIETTTNNLGMSLESKDIVDLPVNGRDIDKLYIMAPGVTGDPSGAGGEPGSYGQFSANGNRDRSNNFLLDGTDMNDSYRNLPAINQGAVFAIPGSILPVESIAEVRVLTNFDAEYGRSSGAVINIVTKSGTNDFHGSVFEYFRNSVLNARNFFNTVGPKDAFRNNQFGGAVGGPIQKEKTFFYVAYEGQREGLGLTSLNVVPTLGPDPFLPGGTDYQSAVNSIGGPNPGACDPAVAGNTISGCITANISAFNPVIQNLYNRCSSNGHCSGGTLPWPTPNLATSATNPFNNVSSDSGSNDGNSVILKIDHSFTPKQTLTGRYFYGQSDQSLPLGTGGGNNIPNTNTVSPTNVNLASISLVSVLAANKVNEARFGFNRFHEGFFAQDASVFGNPAATIGLNTCLGNVFPDAAGTCAATGNSNADPRNFGLPQINVLSGLSQLGSSRFANPRERIDRNYQFIDNFSWKFSKNDVKFGFEYRHTSVDSLQNLNYRGRLKFDDLTNFISGVTNSCFTCYINYGDTRRFSHQDSFGFYIQDSWQIAPRVTINAGLRWDYFGIIGEGNNQYSSYDPAVGLVQLSQTYPHDLNNFAPRLAIAWDVTGKGKTVVRAGLGTFFDSGSFDFFTGQLFENTNNGGPAYNAIGSRPIFQGAAIGGPLAVGVPVFDNSNANPGQPGNLGFDTFDASTIGPLVTPYVYNFTFNVQHELYKGTVLQVGYVGTQGRKLQRIVDLNQPSLAAITAYDVTCAGGLGISLTNCPFGTGVSRNFNQGAPFPLPGQIMNAANMSPLAPFAPFYLQQLQTTARSSYNSLQVSLSTRNFHGFTQQLNYTWSHAIDDASDGQDFVPHAGQPNDSTNPHGSNRGNSNFDVRHHFVWTGSYSFPKYHALGRMGEGWLVSSVVTIMSGHPVEMVNSFDDYDGSGEFFGRPDLVAPVHYNFGDPTQWLDLSSFAVPCTLDGVDIFAANCLSGTRHFGTLGRNALRGPAFRQWDFSLVKDTKLTERLSLQFRADFFNILNHPNFSNPLLPSFFDDVASFSSPNLAGRFSGFFPIVATVDTGIGNPILGGGGPRSIQFAVKLSF